MSFYDLQINQANGEKLNFTTLKGKTVLIVNTATKCGLAGQFSALEELHQSYAIKGLVVIGVPCNQFLSQEPETNETMSSACLLNHGVTFALTEKVHVNGKYTHPVFKYLKEELKGFLGGLIKWNFTKFLINSEGKPVKRYAPKVNPKYMIAEIENELSKARVG
ncbi:MAG: glutathione peroxidase [Flavobacteriales bacterium]